MAPPPQLYVANPAPQFSLEQKAFKLQLQQASAPHCSEIRGLASGRLLQFPDLQLLEMDSGKTGWGRRLLCVPVLLARLSFACVCKVCVCELCVKCECRLCAFSGKLEALAVLLHKLKAESRRVLIFTQMVRMLDILEMFLDHHQLTYVRVSESLPLEERQVPSWPPPALAALFHS